MGYEARGVVCIRVPSRANRHSSMHLVSVPSAREACAHRLVQVRSAHNAFCVVAYTCDRLGLRSQFAGAACAAPLGVAHLAPPSCGGWCRLGSATPSFGQRITVVWVACLQFSCCNHIALSTSNLTFPIDFLFPYQILPLSANRMVPISINRNFHFTISSSLPFLFFHPPRA